MTFLRHLFLVALSLAAAALITGSNGELIDRCGDCWCVADGGNGDCPTDETGIVDSLVPTSDYLVMNTFRLTNTPEFLKLQTSDGNADCYPFTDSLGVKANYPESNFPQCVIPESTDETVCAYKYNADDTVCTGREYEPITYDSEATAVTDEAVVTHKGGK
jgi:hypothetical protein